jgi:glycosyltransferase involved in cell wall biosynthesis
MRILASLFACQPHRGSEPGNGWNFAAGLAARGHDVTCLTATECRESIVAELERCGLPGGRLRFEFVEPPALIAAVWQARQVPYFLKARLRYWGWQLSAYRLARTLCRAGQRFDVVHHLTFGSLLGGSRLWRLGLPFVFGPVGGGQRPPLGLRRYYGSYWRQEQLRIWCQRIVLRFSFNLRSLMRSQAVVLTSNDETRRLAERLGARRARILLDAVLPDDFYPAINPCRVPADTLRILWVGRVLPLKGLTLVLDALRRVSPRVRYRFTIVGDGPYRHEVESWVDQYGLADRVDWKGLLPWTAVREEYAAHDLFLFASMRDTCPAQLMEAMAFGLPIVTLNLHGAGLAVPDTAGIKVTVSDADSTAEGIARAVELLAYDPRRRQECGAKAAAHAREFSWSKRLTQYEELYQSLLTS